MINVILSLIVNNRKGVSRGLFVWPTLRFIGLFFFFIGMLYTVSLMGEVQADTSTALTSKRIKSMVDDVKLGSSFRTEEFSINPKATLYVFAGSNVPKGECQISIENYNSDKNVLNICMCVGPEFRVCESKNYKIEIDASLRIDDSMKIKVSKGKSGAIVIGEVI